MPRKGENIYKRKDGRWEGRYIKERLDGKIKYGYIFAKTYTDAKQKLLIKKSDNEILNSNISKDFTKIQSDTFQNVSRNWLESQRPQLKQSSLIKYNNILKIHLLPTFSEIEISFITREQIIEFSNNLLTSGNKNKTGLAPKTVNSIISVMKNIFSYASHIKGYTVADIKDISVKQPQKEMRVLSQTEQIKLSEYLSNNLNSCNLGILLCLYTGLRVGEICALKWEDIYFEEHCLYIHHTMQRIQVDNNKDLKTRILISSPKSECSIRKIPLPDELYNLLLQNKGSKESYVLTGLAFGFINRQISRQFSRTPFILVCTNSISQSIALYDSQMSYDLEGIVQPCYTSTNCFFIFIIKKTKPATEYLLQSANLALPKSSYIQYHPFPGI